MRAVIDTNVLVAALRSRRGAANAILRKAARKRFEIALSVPLFCEYLDVLVRPGMVPLSPAEVEEFCLSLAGIAHLQDIYFLWRPLLPDPKDDMVLELAVASEARYLVTFNAGDFRPAAAFQLRVVTPAQFLSLL
ncbi:MAG: putative toxin-antitoxin system toxin component, PIN family [Opitutaceae bacterium]|jgi:putative PIN family toxin of toxin-antitoxin system|nr:putative toxin-antitoxin system toxin component, PIN family [Opitutaceae bacterium]